MTHILLAIGGTTPAVITETIWALAVQNKITLSKVIILTTQVGKEALDPKVEEICRAMAGHYPKASIPGGEQIEFRTIKHEDIRTDKENGQVANYILAQVAEICADPSTTVHASMAGGRKTMGYFLAAAMQFFGRPQDRLYHVLVDPVFESIREFRYPGPKKGTLILEDRQGKKCDTYNAKVELAEIPFITLAGYIPDIQSVAKGLDLNFNRLIARARADLLDEHLDVHVVFSPLGEMNSWIYFGEPDSSAEVVIKFKTPASYELIVYATQLSLQKKSNVFEPNERDLLPFNIDILRKMLMSALGCDDKNSPDFRENKLAIKLQEVEDALREGSVDDAIYCFIDCIRPRLSSAKTKIENSFAKNPIHNPARYCHDSKAGTGYALTIPPEKIHFHRRDDRGRLIPL